LGAAIGFEAGGDGGLGFERLLIETSARAAPLVKAVGTDGYEVPAVGP